MRRLVTALVAATLSLPLTVHSATAVATFAGGCFWCVEADFEKLAGVTGAVSGYTGGHTLNPTYEETSAGHTGHAEAVEVTYDPARISYEQLLEYFWHQIDPLTANAQFCDRGSQYRSAIYHRNEQEQQAAIASRAKVQEQLGQSVVTEIAAAGKFYPAEEYHQDYYKKNPIRYRYYRHGCGRDARLKEIWGPKLGK